MFWPGPRRSGPVDPAARCDDEELPPFFDVDGLVSLCGDDDEPPCEVLFDGNNDTFCRLSTIFSVILATFFCVLPNAFCINCFSDGEETS